MTARLRVRVAAAVLLLSSVALACAPVQPSDHIPACTPRDGAIFILTAQAVPSATLLPCVDVTLPGWQYSGFDIGLGHARFWLDSDRAGIRAVEVLLTDSCDVSDAIEVRPHPDEAGTRRYEEPLTLDPAFTANRYYVFPGGCVTYRYRFVGGASPTLALEADQALGFLPRSRVVEVVRDELDLTLCGAGAPPCAR